MGEVYADMAIIHRVRLGTCNTYLIQGHSGYILVDAGNANREKLFLKHLVKHNISPGQIKLIVITHAHYDHVGSLSAIKYLCQCPVAVHQREAGLLREGRFIMPPGTNMLGKTVACIGNKMAWTGFFKYKPVQPELVIYADLPLGDYGLSGFVTATPGHTGGSVSVVLPTGEAFVGDLAVNLLGSVFPPFAENVPELLTSWRKLARLGVKTIFPAHGVPFGINLIKERQEALAGRLSQPEWQPS